jgi:hypothetical protein
MVSLSSLDWMEPRSGPELSPVVKVDGLHDGVWPLSGLIEQLGARRHFEVLV